MCYSVYPFFNRKLFSIVVVIPLLCASNIGIAKF